MVTMKDYEGMHGFGQITQGDVDDLNKALGAGYQNPATSGSNVLRPQSLENTMRVLTYTLQHIQFFKDIPKLPAYSTVEEYNVQMSYGGPGGAFTNAGELPQVQDASYARRTALVKFISTQREVDHPTTIVRPAHGSVIAQETQNGATWILEQVERACWAGRSDLIAQSWDGIDQQIRNDPTANTGVAATSAIIDLRGGIITEDIMESATNKVIEAYGVPTHLYGAPKGLSEMVKQFYPRERFAMPAPVDGTVGMSIKAIETMAGKVALRGNMFLRSGGNNGVKSAPASATAPRAPIAPASIVGSNVAGPTTGTYFTAADTGTYQYKVTAVNRFGESAAVQESGGVAMTGDAMSLVITNGSDTSDVATGYRLYRSAVGGAAGTEQLIAEIPRLPGAATTTFVDMNQRIPGTSRAYLNQMNLQALSFRQLAPMMKIALATIALSVRWAQALYGTPIIYATRKFVIFDNVKDD